MTNPIADLQQRIIATFPLAHVDLDEPLREGGAYHVDVRMGDRLAGPARHVSSVSHAR